MLVGKKEVWCGCLFHYAVFLMYPVCSLEWEKQSAHVETQSMHQCPQHLFCIILSNVVWLKKQRQSLYSTLINVMIFINCVVRNPFSEKKQFNIKTSYLDDKDLHDDMMKIWIRLITYICWNCYHWYWRKGLTFIKRSNTLISTFVEGRP